MQGSFPFNFLGQTPTFNFSTNSEAWFPHEMGVESPKQNG
jgi:hypothetical protein